MQPCQVTGYIVVEATLSVIAAISQSRLALDRASSALAQLGF
jgi:hypothetical protein